MTRIPENNKLLEFCKSSDLEFCKSSDLYIVNDRIGNDQYVGAATTSKNTLIDYAIVSPLLFKCISYFNIAKFDPILSDIHFPVVINFDTSLTLEPNNV